jgi:CheY-like chemotaxis protein
MPTILLADDSITIQKIVNLTFSGEGIDVVTFGNGDAALKKIHEIHPDVVLADIFMPGKNGYEVCDAIKNDPELHATPVILLVGAFEPFDANEATRVKADAHLTKPFEIKVLVSAVDSLIRQPEQIGDPMDPAPAETMEAEISLPQSPVVNVVDSCAPLPEMPLTGRAREALSATEGGSEQHFSEPAVSVALGVTVEEAAGDPIQGSESSSSFESAFAHSYSREGNLPPMPMIEESDPLGLLATDSQVAGVPAEHTFDSRSLVVDIWDSRSALDLTSEPTRGASAEVVSLNDIDPLVQSPQRSAQVQKAEVQATSEEPAASEMSATSPKVETAESLPNAKEHSEPQRVGTAALGSDPISDELVERIADRVVERLSRDVIERIAWEVVPDLAELIIKEHVETQLKQSGRG